MKFKGFTVKLLIAAIVFIIALSLIIVYFGEILGILSKIIGFLAPFILAFLLSLVLNPLADKLNKKFKLPRTLTAILLIVLVVGILGGFIGAIIYKVIDEIKSLYLSFPKVSESIIEWIMNIRLSFENIYSSMPEYVQTVLDSLFDNIQLSLSHFIDKNYRPVVHGAGNIAKKIPGIFIGIIVFLLALFFMVSDKENVNNVVRKIIPQKVSDKIKNIFAEIKKTLGGYLKAQLVIMSVVFVIVIVGLYILGAQYALLIALAIALLDGLPFFGSGAVLIPWSIVSFINSDIKFGIGLLIIYLSVLLTRQMIEPKIVSSKIGINPLVTLISMYVGYRVFSIGGMILGPIVLVLVISFNKAGVFEPIERFFKFIFRYLKKEVNEFGKYIDKK